MTTDLRIIERAVRRAYEIGRWRRGLFRGLVVAAAMTALATITVGRSALVWALVPWLAWALIEWRGGALRTGGIRGLVAGAVILVLPVTWLRPCCSPGMALGEGACCSDPSMCIAAGGLIGLLAIMAIPTARYAASPRRSLEAIIGVTLGIASAAGIRCTALVAGEAAGLACGALLGLAVAAGVRAFLVTRARSLTE